MQHTTITNSQIRTLASEAWEAGDSATTALCMLALGELDETRYPLDAIDLACLAGASPEQARAGVAEILAGVAQ